MRTKSFGERFKDAVGAVFLLMAAFFVCSTLLSMRAVFADPVAPQSSAPVARTGVQSPRAAQNSANRAGNRATTTATAVAPTRATAARPISSRTMATTPTRGVATRTTNSRATVNRAVVSRGATTPTAARVSLQGSAIRGTNSASVTLLSSKLYTGNYSNIIDQQTGLISADAYSNCMNSYYTCMDEICTARNQAQRRCACAGRVRAFADAESQLEKANEELIKASGELALLIANKGKDVSGAFTLTEAEQVMNCVSWQDENNRIQSLSSGKQEAATEWCENHMMFTGCATASGITKPSYCSATGNDFGFSVDGLNGSGSDILATLSAWAKSKDATNTIVDSDTDNLIGRLDITSSVIGQMTGIDGAFDDVEYNDGLANTWGYDLFAYAHNNVCARVLDSCFNGIYEACGSPTSGGKCNNGKSTCPYNFNSNVNVTSNGDDLNFITAGGSSYNNANTATCFGYTGTDPYSGLRGPVADARRSILQKYALDANADCDAYGEQIRATAQNIGYQKVAAQQALQQKRLEFAQEEATTIASDFRASKDNFGQCLSELYECYTKQETANTSWSTSRIKTYCSTVDNAPSCYEPMICGAPNNQLEAVITKADTTTACDNTTNVNTNTCRNLVTIAEVLSGSYANGAVAGSSAQLRETCLGGMGIEGVRNWSSTNSGGWSATNCPSSQHMEGNSCVPNTKTCAHSDANSATSQQTWISTSQSWGGCTVLTCKAGYSLNNGACVEVVTP